jgi:hypothetical protein
MALNMLKEQPDMHHFATMLLRAAGIPPATCDEECRKTPGPCGCQYEITDFQFDVSGFVIRDRGGVHHLYVSRWPIINGLY